VVVRRARSQPAEKWEQAAGAVILQRLDSIDATLSKLGESMIALARVEERHGALEKALAGHVEEGVEYRRVQNATNERITKLVEKIDERVDALEQHRDEHSILRSSKEQRRMYWIGILGVIAAVALVAVEFWAGHQDTLKHIDAQPDPVVIQTPLSQDQGPARILPPRTPQTNQYQMDPRITTQPGQAIRNPDR
jgi:hypothetical protein